MKEIDKSNKSFEDIKHIYENGVEFWYVRKQEITEKASKIIASSFSILNK